MTHIKALAFESMREAAALVTSEGKIFSVNDTFVEMFGFETPEQVLQTDRQDLWEDPSKAGSVLAVIREGGSFFGELGLKRVDGFSFIGMVRGTRIDMPASAECTYSDEFIYVVAVQDITDLRAAEKKAQQAQKMEAVGQLTGGVAHDFNNMLMSMQLNLEFLAEEVAGNSAAERYAETISAAIDDGARLTTQLLAFSRSQVLEVDALDVNKHIESQVMLLGRTLPEDIEIDLEVSPDLYTASVDESQLAAALLIVTVNARDAMPDDGVFRITAENRRLTEDDVTDWEKPVAGDYIEICLKDTGRGMTPDTLSRAVEPFFTTKEVGQGSGMGLSMVYGFAVQSGGHIALDSEPGVGTSVCLFLPRSESLVKGAHDTPAVVSSQGGQETILVVEDDRDVRTAVVMALTRLGYVVHSAESGPHAVKWMDENETALDLVLTDMVMPDGMNGHQVAEHVVARQPCAKVLYISGYTDTMERPVDQLEYGGNFIQKPFAINALSAKVRSVLDQAE